MRMIVGTPSLDNLPLATTQFARRLTVLGLAHIHAGGVNTAEAWMHVGDIFQCFHVISPL